MDPTTLALIAAIAPTLTGMLTLLAAVLTRRAVKEVHISLNSRLSELLAVTAKEQRAAGVAEGKAAR
jgi:hypothetical protein